MEEIYIDVKAKLNEMLGYNAASESDDSDTE